MERWLAAVDRWGKGWAVVAVAMTVWAAWGLGRLEVEESPERWMPKGVVEDWMIFDRHFDVGDTIAVGLEFRRPVKDEDVQALEALRKELAQAPGMKQVYDVSLVAQEIEGVGLTTLIGPRNRERFALYEGTLWSEPDARHGGQTLLTVCELKFYPPGQEAELNKVRREAVEWVYGVADRARKKPEFQQVKLHVASGVVMMLELEKRARGTAVTFLPASMALGMVCLWGVFRSGRALWLAALGAGTAMCWVFGATAWLDDARLGVLTLAAPTLITVIAVAAVVHFAAYAGEQGESDPDLPDYRQRLVRWVGAPCLGAALTTGVGFLMLSWNELGPVRDLGWQLCLGAVSAFFVVFLATRWFPIRRAKAGRWLDPRHLERFARWSTARPKTTAAGMTLLAAAMTAGLWPWPGVSPGLKVDADPFSFFGPEQPITQARDHLADKKFGLYQLEVVLIPKHPGQPPQGARFADETFRANQQTAAEFSKKVTDRADLGVMRVVSTQAFAERQKQFLAELNRVRLEEGWWAAADKGRRVLEHRRMFENTFQSWAHDKQGQGALRLTFLAHDRSPAGFEALLDFVQRELPNDRFECSVSGAIATVVHLSQGLVTGMAAGLGASLLVMAVLCWALFRSARLAALAFLPNAFPMATVYGLMGWCGLPLSSGSAMVATVALGVALNDTIHLLLHYRKLTRDEGRPTDQAVQETLEHLGRPVVMTSLVHLAGFSIFLLTDFLPLYHFGLLGGLSMLAALAGDLILLPNLLLTFDRRGGACRSPTPEGTGCSRTRTPAAV